MINSEGCPIKKFTESEYMFSESVKQLAEELETHTYMKWTIEIETVVKNSIKTALKEYKLSQLKETEKIAVVLAVGNLPTTKHEVDCKEIEVTAPYKFVDGTHEDEMFDQSVVRDECHISILKDIKQIPTMQKHVLKRVNVKFIF